MIQDDYKLITSVFKSEVDRWIAVESLTELSGVVELMASLIIALEEKYPDFDRDKFLKDCGIN